MLIDFFFFFARVPPTSLSELRIGDSNGRHVVFYPSDYATSRHISSRHVGVRLSIATPTLNLLQTRCRHYNTENNPSKQLLYASTPIDASLYNLYIHQNYTQFCEEIEQCERLVDGLSWVDASGGENVTACAFLFLLRVSMLADFFPSSLLLVLTGAIHHASESDTITNDPSDDPKWYQSNPYTFHISTLSTLHALPSPVPRKNQKMHKPEFFENLRKTRSADEDGVEGVQEWLTKSSGTGSASGGTGGEGEGGDSTIQPASLWSRHSIVLELPGVLKALSHRPSHPHRPPPTNHTLFSSLPWSRHASSMAVTLEEGDDEAGGAMDEMERELPETGTAVEVDDDGDGGGAEVQNGWLEDDEIEDW